MVFCPNADWTCTPLNIARTCGSFDSVGGSCSGLNAYPNATISDYGSISGNSAMQNEIYHGGPIACGIDAMLLLSHLDRWFTAYQAEEKSTVGRKFPIENVTSYTVKKDCSYLYMLMTKNWLERNKILIRCGKLLNKEVDSVEPTSFLDHVYLGHTQRQCERSKGIVDNYRTMFESRISAGGTEKLPFPQNLGYSSWSYDMEGHAKKCVERYCELANKTTQQLYKVSTPCIDDHHFTEEETKSVGELSNTCSQIVLKCLYLARIGRPDILWSVTRLARSITKWTKACDKRLNRLISYIHHTSEYKQYCHVGNTAKQCRLGLFQDSDFAGHLEDSKSTSGWTFCVFGSHTFVPISWMCKKQTSVSHSSTESEIIQSNCCKMLILGTNWKT